MEQQTEHYDFALALLDKIKAALADGGVMPQTLPDGVQLIVRERAEYSRKYHEAMEILSRWENIDHATASATTTIEANIRRAVEADEPKGGTSK